jgi:hypothetical protein
MAVDSHIHQLELRHKELETRLEQVLSHPSSDDTEIAEIKRQKLFIKDKITRLRQMNSVH